MNCYNLIMGLNEWVFRLAFLVQYMDLMGFVGLTWSAGGPKKRSTEWVDFHEEVMVFEVAWSPPVSVGFLWI